MADLTVQDIPADGTGLVVTYAAAAAGGDAFVNDGRTRLRVKNAGAGSINVTINSQRACNQGFDHDEVAAVAAAEERELGPFDTGRFNDSTGKVQLTYSGVTSVTVAAVKD